MTFPMTFPVMSKDTACATLSTLGLHFTPADVSVEARDDRWLVRLPGQRLAWFAANDAALQRMATERRVLGLLRARCTFEVPAVLSEDTAGELDVRSMVGCDCDASRIEADARDHVAVATTIGAAVGKILAEQHTRIALADVPDCLPRAPSWPKSRAWVFERLRAVIDDRALLAGADVVLKAYDDVRVREADCALVHTDVALHNLAFDRHDHVCGMYDYEEAAWADRHHDFRYLVIEGKHDTLLEIAISEYQALTGYTIQRDRVMLYNAACALTYLAHRARTSPDERSCGRTLDEDLQWSTAAVERVVGGRVP